MRLLFGVDMQRLFSTFADSWPGKGLLIQRALVVDREVALSV